MALSESEIRKHAERIIAEHNMEYEFCLVYEDEELEDASEQDWRAVLEAMYAARVNVTWGA